MGFNYLVIGAGGMGEAIVYDLLKDKDTSGVKLVDTSVTNARNVQLRLNDPRLKIGLADASDKASMLELMQQADVAIGASSYDHNVALTNVAIDASTHFCDLGGNIDVVGKQFALDKYAKNSKVKIVPATGIAPGAVNTIVEYGIDKMLGEGIGMPDGVYIRVGGLPQKPQSPLNYKKVFSVHGLINECIEPVEVLLDGKLQIVEPLTGIEKIVFKDPRLNPNTIEFEAVYTSGGSSTLAKTYEGVFTEMNYKTIRFQGHWAKIKALNELGFFKDTLRVGDKTLRPREISEAVIENAITYDSPDMLLVRVILMKDEYKLVYDMVDFQDEKTGHTAMQRTTGYTASIIAQMMAKDIIAETGVLTIERSVPSKEFIQEWARRGIFLREWPRT